MAVENETTDTQMTSADHTAAALHSALDAVLADDSAGKDKAKKLARVIKAMHDDEEEAEDESGTQETPAVEAAEPGGEMPTEKTSASDDGKTEKTESEIKDEAAKKRAEAGTAEQKPVNRGELFEQAAVTHPRVDRAKGIIYRAHVLGNQSKHGYRYDVGAQKTVAKRFEGMAVGIDHDYQSNPLKVSNAFGTLRNPVVDENGTWADLHYLTTHEQAPAILEDIERGTGIFALSSVNGRVIEHNGVITSFVPGRVDVVVGGATTRTVLEQAAPAVSKSDYDDLKTRFEQLQAKTVELEKRMILREQYIAPQTTVQVAIEKTTAKIDVQKFWNDPK